MYTDKDYRALLADIDERSLSDSLLRFKNGENASVLTTQDNAVLARLVLMRGKRHTAPTVVVHASGIDQTYLARAEMIAAGKVRSENDRKGQELYKKLLADIDRENGCRCGYGSRLRGVKMQVAHFLKNLEA